MNSQWESEIAYYKEIEKRCFTNSNLWQFEKSSSSAISKFVFKVLQLEIALHDKMKDIHREKQLREDIQALINNKLSVIIMR